MHNATSSVRNPRAKCANLSFLCFENDDSPKVHVSCAAISSSPDNSTCGAHRPCCIRRCTCAGFFVVLAVNNRCGKAGTSVSVELRERWQQYQYSKHVGDEAGQEQQQQRPLHGPISVFPCRNNEHEPFAHLRSERAPASEVHRRTRICGNHRLVRTYVRKHVK